MTDKAKEIEERWAGATAKDEHPAPWNVEYDYPVRVSSMGCYEDQTRVLDADSTSVAQVFLDDPTATAIAHAPEDIKWLLRRVRELEEGIEEAYREGLGDSERETMSNTASEARVRDLWQASDARALLPDDE